ncbi:MAG: GMC family oxidoreductase N-terminal domain-containing protein [Bacteroidota bacterium]
MKKVDYIIIGAGSAGCVLANRLSENPTNRVLVLEAGGPDKDMNIHIPGAYSKLHKSAVDWSFWTEPQEHVLNRSFYLPRGKTLGGCSSTNAMAYVRGNRADYDGWAALGNEGWEYDSILPYFIRSESNENYDQVDEGYHGKDGEINVGFPRGWKSPFSQPFIDACQQVGIPFNADYNGQTQTGTNYFQFTIKQTKRHSAAVAFLKPALKRPNLEAITRAHVSKIIVKKNKAVGVEYLDKRKQKHSIYAEKEIILSAGTFKSPQILMLSGIGDAEELDKQNIACVHELKGVGKNLQDHLFYSVAATTHLQKGLNHYIPTLSQLGAAFNYFVRKTGPFAIGPLEAVAFFDIYNQGNPANFQFHFTPMHIGKGYDTDLYDLATFPTHDGFTIMPTLLYPESRGYVGLRSNDPFEAPVVQPNFLEKKEDLNQLVRGGKVALDVMNQSKLKPLIKEIIAPLDWSSDEAIARHIKHACETVYHPVGTCKMGQDEMAVVDSELSVHGIDNLRVVDASIMPKIVAGNTNAPTYMIAEKAADMILGTTLRRENQKEGVAAK